MATQIKITELGSIANANLTSTTLFAAVNMVGTPITQKVTLQQIGNIILSSAGNGSFPIANIANIAYTIVNAAQPNITSVGTLTSLSVSGNANLGNAVQANFFIGDGGLLSNISVIGGNANYSNFAGTAFAVSGANVTGVVANATFATSAGSANTATTATTAESANTANTATFATTAGSANTAISVSGANVSGEVANANYATYAGTAYSVDSANVSGLGNIAAINLDGNVSNVLRGNGTWSPVDAGVSLPLANGNSNFNIATANGNATITANSGTAQTWSFGTDGVLVLPSGNTGIGSILGIDAIVTIDKPFGIVSQGNGSTILQWSDSISNTNALSAIYINSLDGNIGDIILTTGGIGANANVWNFGADGNLTLPRGGSLYSEAAPISGNMIVLNPHGSGSITNQKLMVYPTLADGDHLHLATGNLYETELFLGTDDFYVKLANTGDVVVNANDNIGNTSSWTFGANGTLTSLGNISVGGNISGNSIAIDTQLIMGNGTGGSITGVANISTDALSVTGNASVGNIIFSDATVQSTAWTGVTPGAATLIVDSNGDDLTATGSVSNPFATIQSAHDYAVTNIASTAYIVIQLNAGNYSGNIVLTRPKTAIVGASDGVIRSSWIAGSITVNMTSGATILSADIFSLENVIVASSGSSVITLGGNQRYVFFSRNVYGYTSGASSNVLTVTNTSVGGLRVDLLNTTLQSDGGGTGLATTNTYYLNINASTIIANSGPAMSTTTTTGLVTTSRISTQSGSNTVVNTSQFSPGSSLTFGVCTFESATPDGNGLYLTAGSVTSLGGCAFNVPAGSGFAVAGAPGSVLVKSANNNQIAYNTNGNTQGTVTVLPMSYL